MSIEHSSGKERPTLNPNRRYFAYVYEGGDQASFFGQTADEVRWQLANTMGYTFQDHENDIVQDMKIRQFVGDRGPDTEEYQLWKELLKKKGKDQVYLFVIDTHDAVCLQELIEILRMKIKDQALNDEARACIGDIPIIIHDAYRKVLGVHDPRSLLQQ